MAAKTPLDTSPEAAAVRRRIIQGMSLEQKLRQISALSEALRDMMIAGVAYRHPEYTAEECRWAVVRRMLGDDLFAAAYPDAPRLHFGLGGTTE